MYVLSREVKALVTEVCQQAYYFYEIFIKMFSHTTVCVRIFGHVSFLLVKSLQVDCVDVESNMPNSPSLAFSLGSYVVYMM